jgi:MIP family channel proteins
MQHDSRNARKYVAECVGTFVLVFIGAGACIAHHVYPDDITHAGVAMAFGGVVMCMVYGLGHISGAHINPAVTVALMAVGRFPWHEAILYLFAQCSGAFLATTAHLVIFGNVVAGAAQFGATFPIGITLSGAFLLEAILTFVLMMVIMAVATDERVPCGIGGLAIGAAVCVDCLAAGKCCGASMNPARSLAPAIFAGGAPLDYLWLYICAPVAGAILAAYAYDWIRDNSCLEIIAVKGFPKEAQKLGDTLRSVKGVKHGTLSMSTTGKDIE